MGLLIFQRKDEGWFCKIQEEWKVDTLAEAIDLQNFLMENNICYSISYSFELVHIHFNKSLYQHKDYKKFKEIFIKLLDYKKLYGNCMDLKDLIK